MKFIDDEAGTRLIKTMLADPIIGEQEGVQLEPAYDFEDYRSRVNRYIIEHADSLTIYKLTHNKPMTTADYQELERILTQELGSKADYEREYQDTPFGLLVRKIAGLDHEAAMQVFSAFINEQLLNQAQINFVNKIIGYIEKNGYIEPIELSKPPFDRPTSVTRLFDAKTQQTIMDLIRQVRDNAAKAVM